MIANTKRDSEDVVQICWSIYCDCNTPSTDQKAFELDKSEKTLSMI